MRCQLDIGGSPAERVDVGHGPKAPRLNAGSRKGGDLGHDIKGALRRRQLHARDLLQPLRHKVLQAG